MMMSVTGTKIVSENNNIPGDSIRSNGGPSLASEPGAIILPGLDWMLFTHRQREEIRRLKMHNDFRGEGVWYRIIIVLALALIFLILAPILYNEADGDAGYYGFISKYVISTMSLAASGLVMLTVRHGWWFLPTIGKVVDATLTRVHRRRLTLIPGWDISYSYEGQKGRLKSRDATLHIKYCEGRTPQIGDRVYVFFDPMPSHKTIIFVPNMFRKLCVSKSRYYEMKDKPFLRDGD